MTKRLPKKKLNHLLGYIGTVRDELRMQNWNVTLHRVPLGEDDSDAHASTWHQNNHETTNIQISATLLDESPTTIRNTVVHELIHAQHRDVAIVWNACVRDNDAVAAGDSAVWTSDFQMFMERFVSWITRAVEPHITEFDRSVDYGTHPGVQLEGDAVT